MIPEFQNGSGVPEQSPEWFRNPEPFWNVPKYVLFRIFYITGLIIATITFTHIFQISYFFYKTKLMQEILRYNAKM